MNRRAFIKSSCKTCVTALPVYWLVQACQVTKSITNYQFLQGKIILKKSEFLVQKNNQSMYKKFIVIKPEQNDFPIVIYRVNEQQFNAYSLKCTHQGCELTPYDIAMVCPCHGAEFNLKGQVTSGPAETDLQSYSITIDNENIYIQL